MDSSLINGCLQEIGKGYRQGLLQWLKQQPDRWRQMLDLEKRINQTALSKDEVALREALEAYRLFFQDIIKVYGEGETLPLFRASGQGA